MLLHRFDSTSWQGRRRGPITMETADGDDLRNDPAIARAYLRLAVKVFERALEDLASRYAEDAWNYLRGVTDGEDLWYAYVRSTLTGAAVSRTAHRARRLAQRGVPYTAATIWRVGR